MKELEFIMNEFEEIAEDNNWSDARFLLKESLLNKIDMNKKNLENFFEELERIRDFHPSSPEFAKLLSKYDLPFSTREAIEILKKIS